MARAAVPASADPSASAPSAHGPSTVDTSPFEDDALMTGEAVALELRPTNFVLRATGAIIDWIAYLALFGLILIGAFFALDPVMDDALGAAITIAALAFCTVVVPTTVETLSQGKSLGKLAVGARIVRDDGGSIGFRHAFIRALIGVLEILMTVGGIAAIVSLLNDKSKRLGDLLAGTYSQHERVSKVTPPVFGVPIVLAEWARTADVARMPDGLARRIAQFLRQAAGLTPATRSRLSEQLAAEASRYVSPVPRADPELFLAAVAAVRRDREFRALQLQQQHLVQLEPVLGGRPHRFPER
jgi:uncharacterized RDD family membrane protein YckC